MNMKQALLLFSCFYLSFAAQDGGYTLVLEHAFGDGEFTKRGEVHFPNLKGEGASIQNQVSLSKEDIDQLQNLAKQNGFYKLRTSAKLQENLDNQETTWVSTFTTADLFMNSGFTDLLTFNTDGLGCIISITITPLVSDGFLLQETNELDTEIFVITPSQAQMPDTLGFLNKIEEETRKKEIQAKEPQSFFGKYWMFIVPVVLFMMMSNAAQQQG